MQQYHGYSILPILQAVYPNHQWQPWRFVHTPTNYWNKTFKSGSNTQLASFFEYLLMSLGFSGKDKSDWYRITTDMIPKRYQTMLRVEFGGLAPALQKCYPKHKWEFSKVTANRKRGLQAVVRNKVNQVIPSAAKGESAK